MMKIAEDIKRDIAEAMVNQSHPAHDSRYHGEKYIVDTDGDGVADRIFHKEGTALWNPWGENAEYASVDSIIAMFEWEDFWGFDDEDEAEEHHEDAVNFALGYVPDEVSAE